MNITLKQLSKSFAGTTALHPLDLHIRSGEFTTLLGPSGCGKTTLLRLIAGLETPDQGEILLGEECVYSSKRRTFKPVHKRGLGMVFQDFALWPHMTVFENVAFGLRAMKATGELRERVLEAIRAVRLQGLEDRYPGQLSGGQQQRVAFARAIAIRPRVILFDEPLSALDAMLRDEMREELTSLVRSIGLTAVYVTHDQTEAMAMSDQIVVMQQGRVMQKGAPEDIYHRPAVPYVARFVGKSNWLQSDRAMVRPEHVQWAGAPDSLTWNAVIRGVSYVGERYELQLELEDGSVWTAYHSARIRIGERVAVYGSPKFVHSFHNDKEEENDEI
ncbi:ABC transporter ATP-binding protein [Paenibacillus sp. DMB20]|uniref:ABC transporter ATP-binding protein n=1 Tax=Paenibacillus sp. DMB20 TaxID=1642570 RepID=UPI00062798FC|nr:ABC transporter ATP-binding protein [Paenibacillus sp. DMB20]KKO53234.1 ABC transporter ATP-binding protein [Paenibacillus sp. DMB20]